jgi:hypothetical protein
MVECPLRAKNPSRLMFHTPIRLSESYQWNVLPLLTPLTFLSLIKQLNNNNTLLPFIYTSIRYFDTRLYHQTNKMAATKTTLILKASDDGQYTVERSVAEKSGLIKMMIEGEFRLFLLMLLVLLWEEYGAYLR